jgi:ADP-ribose pyrophosphatase YjhB (NUDIX family)
VADEILWIRRGNSPGIGKWAMPGGYMENNETPEFAVCREVREETGIVIEEDSMTLISVSCIPHMAQTHLVFRCHLEEKPETAVTEEALDANWFDEECLPWGELAFPTIEPLVRQVYRWLHSGDFGIRVGFIDESGSQHKTYSLVTT